MNHHSIFSSVLPIKSLKIVSRLKNFNVKYPKALNFELYITKPQKSPQNIDIDLKKTLTKRLICQKLVINFSDYHDHSQSHNNLGVLLRQLPKYSNIKHLTFKLSGLSFVCFISLNSQHFYQESKLAQLFTQVVRKLFT